jgi:hypothetical protein
MNGGLNILVPASNGELSAVPNKPFAAAYRLSTM